MPRVKSGSRRTQKRKKLLKQAKGYKWRRKNVYKLAKEAVMHAQARAYEGRKQRKRDMRRLWNVRINAACRQNGLRYSEFIRGLRQKNIQLDRKVLSDLAQSQPEVFKKIVGYLK